MPPSTERYGRTTPACATAGLGEAAREDAAALRALHQASVAPKGIKATDPGQPPVEVHAENGLRPGDIESWQALDRCFPGLVAALDDPDASLAHHAAAYETVAPRPTRHRSARERHRYGSRDWPLVLRQAPRAAAKADRRTDGVYVCDDCVALCV